MLCPTKALNGRTRVIERQLEHLQITQLLPPVAELRFQYLSLQPATLPKSVVSILQWQLFKHCRVTGGECLVKRADLSHQHSTGPAVRDDVVHRNDEYMFILFQTQDERSQKRPATQIERAEYFLADKPARLGLTLVNWEGPEVDNRNRDRRRRCDYLPRATIDGLKSGPQNLVTTHNLGKSFFECGSI